VTAPFWERRASQSEVNAADDPVAISLFPTFKPGGFNRPMQLHVDIRENRASNEPD